MFSIINNEDPTLNPTLLIANFEFREPITTLTDFLTALVCFYAYYKLSKQKECNHPSFVNYKYYFLLFAIGMTSAAWFGHGLQSYVGFNWKIIGWVMSASALLVMEFGSIKELKNIITNKLLYIFYGIFIIQYIAMVSLMIITKDFSYPQINSTISLVLFVLPIHIIAHIKTKKTGHMYIYGAIIYGAIPGLIYNNQIGFSKWLNHHDISHILMSIFMFIVYMGVKNISLSR